jgi:hypothetical protein
MIKPRPISIMKDPGSFVKFCTKNDKAFECKKAFGCYLSCPLWLAREVEFLVTEKGMTIGEAHRACLRAMVEDKDKSDVMRDAVKGVMEGKPEYIVMEKKDDE